MCGEPDLEKAMQKEKQEMIKLKIKDRRQCSAAIVDAPTSFLKPCNFTVGQVVTTQHGTLRDYKSLPKNSSTEVDPSFNLYPNTKQRNVVLDELDL